MTKAGKKKLKLDASTNWEDSLHQYLIMFQYEILQLNISKLMQMFIRAPASDVVQSCTMNTQEFLTSEFKQCNFNSALQFSANQFFEFLWLVLGIP